MGEDSSPQMSSMVGNYPYDRDRLEYELTVRQEPKQARMCGVGGKADRRPIDPPPIIQLRVIDPTASRRPTGSSPGSAPSSPMSDSSPVSRHGNAPTSATDDPNTNRTNAVGSRYAQNFLQNPYYFMFASLAKPDDDAELHWLKDGRTRCTTGSVVSSLYHLKDTEHRNEDAGFFVFPDLSVRTEGSYRLKLSLFEVVGNNVCHCKSIYSAPFYVYTAKKFPGMEESTPLSCSLADQGIKIRIRKDIRVRKRPIHALEHPLHLPLDDSSVDNDDDVDRAGAEEDSRRTSRSEKRDSKRGRFDNRPDNATMASPDAPGRPAHEHLPWPTTTADSTLGATGSGPPQVIPPPPPPGGEQPSIGVGLPGPSVYDGRGGGGGYHPYDPPHQQHSSHGHQGYRSAETAPPPSQPPSTHAPAYPQPHTPYGPPPGQHIPPPPPPHVPPSSQHVAPAPQHSAPAPTSQHLPPPAHTIPPPPPQQHSHIPPAPAHLGHIPPPPHAHHTGPPPPPPPPPSQQGYVPYAGGWGPPPPPQQTQVYDPYPHHSQHQPPATHHQHPPHSHLHQQHYGPPPAPQQMHHGPPIPPPPPSRYDYSGSTYAPQQQPPYSGYYDQLTQQHPPPPAYGGSSPRLAPPSLPASGQPQAQNPANANVGGSSGYGEYSYSRGSPPPTGRGYQHHQYGPPPPPPSAPGSSYAPDRYHPPSYHYNYNAPPPLQTDSWGPPAASGQATQGYSAWGSDAYGSGSASASARDPGYNSSPGGTSVSGLVGAVGNPGDRIQLAPLRAGHGGITTSPHSLPLSLPGSGGPGGGAGYPVVHMKSHERGGSGGYGTGARDVGSERDRERGGPSGRDSERGGKKNPLSIGSIISDETG